MLRERTLGKYYLCLVEGKVKEDARIAGYLTKEEKNNKVSLHKEKTEGASYIETEYRVLKSTDKASLLKIRLITGQKILSRQSSVQEQKQETKVMTVL